MSNLLRIIKYIAWATCPVSIRDISKDLRLDKSNLHKYIDLLINQEIIKRIVIRFGKKNIFVYLFCWEVYNKKTRGKK